MTAVICIVVSVVLLFAWPLIFGALVALGEGIHQALVRESYTVDWLQDGSSALHALLSETFDLAVLDLGLPRMDGFGLGVGLHGM